MPDNDDDDYGDAAEDDTASVVSTVVSENGTKTRIEDNMGTWHTVNNPTSTAQASRHLDVRYFKVRDHIHDGKLRVHFLRTEHNVSDFFTKGLPNPAFRSFMQILMGTMSSNY